MEAYVVFLIIAIALVLFVSEVLPNDITAIGVIVSLAAVHPVLGIDIGIEPEDAISGFANPATITIVAMYMLSAGVQNSGLVERLGIELAKLTNRDEKRTLLATVGATGPLAGFVNNTPVVAVFIPMISDLADRSQVSPSKLLLPLSFAAILGGMLTLIGTSTNLIASNLADVLIDDRGPIGFFEFTPLGLVILIVGLTYLMTIGRRLTPSRVEPAVDLTATFELEDHLYQLGVREGSSLIGVPIHDIGEPEGLTLIQLDHDQDSYSALTSDRPVEVGDRIVVLGRYGAVETFASEHDLLRLYGRTVDESTFDDPERGGTLAKLVVPEDSAYVGQALGDIRLGHRYETRVLAVKRGSDTYHRDVEELFLEAGDLLLVRSNDAALSYLTDRGDVVRVDELSFDPFAEDAEEDYPISQNGLLAIGTMIGVVALAAAGILPIVIAALLGVIVMVATGCLTPSEAYDAVSWNIIFLLAGVIPLGLAMQQTGGAMIIADMIYQSHEFLPLIGVLFLVVIITGVLANVITPIASVVLMIPVAVDTASQLGANEFAFLLGVMFASASSFMTPIGYQTNLMVYGPGGYEFTDFLKVGGPLQLLVAVVTTVGIWFYWGLAG